MIKPNKVYCVVTIFTGMSVEGERVSQFYSRASDAKRKSKSLNESSPWTKPVSFTLSEINMEDI